MHIRLMATVSVVVLTGSVVLGVDRRALGVETFTAARLKELRDKASQVAQVPRDTPNGWSKSQVDPARLVEVFAPLRVRSGVVLRAYQFKEGGNGNGVVWAMPADAEFPEPDRCPKVQRIGGFLMVPKPPAAVDSVMEQIEGDGSAWSYLAASLLGRELWEFGALWHGTNWGTHSILDGPPQQGGNEGDPMFSPRTPADEWQWSEPRPTDWLPQVAIADGRVTVRFYTYSGYLKETIYRHTDTYAVGKYGYQSDRREIATGKGGFVF